ncbi:MAG: hypothetical protein Q8L95_04955 [Burkholderiales bacterium]|nr:hypothetical protein [Burkholderiales bacterium]
MPRTIRFECVFAHVVPDMIRAVLIAGFLALSPLTFASGMGVEDTPLRPSELKLLQRIAAVDPAFRYGDRVKRYYRTQPITKNRIPLRVELIPPRSKGLYFGDYTSFRMIIDEPSGMVTYDYAAGTANRGRGTILVTPKDVVKTEFRCGTTLCTTRIERNGRVVAERSD